ncbi:MAG TPA: DEAD/DEAH box helicase, partial [Chondromyces sp.]|nr:DEAD/DEAH box helicase [Chondromyces sp.]
MIRTREIMIHMELLENEKFWLFATDNEGNILPSGFWTRQLFAGHEESFFGSMLTEYTKDGVPGVLLTAWEWVTLLNGENFNRFIHWHWDELGDFGLGISSVLYEAVTEGQWLPTFEGDKVRWTVPSSVWEEFSPTFWDETIGAGNHRILTEKIFRHSVEQAFFTNHRDNRAEQRLRSLSEGTLTNEELMTYFDLTRWRQWLGIEENDTPFTIGLRLIEPEHDGEDWLLETILKSKKDESKIYQLGKRVPKSWTPFLQEAEQEEQRWIRMFPWLNENGKLRNHLSEELAFLFLTEASEKLIQLGIDILLPSWWETIRQSSLSLSAKVTAGNTNYRPSFVGLNAILDFNWRLSMNGVDFSEEEFEQLAAQNRRLIKINGEWVHLDPEMVRKIQHLMIRAKNEGLRIQDLLEQELAPEEGLPEDTWMDPRMFAQIQIDLNRSLRKMIDQLKDVSSIPLESAPDGLQGTLRPYQQLGMSWLFFLRSFGFGGCLADDMGLGKTIQLISYLLKVKETEQPEMPALIICPTSVLGNWQKELERFAPGLNVMLHYGSNRSQGEDFHREIKGKDVILTSYSLSHLDSDTLSPITWNTIALDEAQNIKNAHTKQSRAIRQLKGLHHIALTGTPMENRLSELWAIFDFINKGYLGSLQQFQKRYIVPIEKDHDKFKVQQLQAKIRPFLLRRTKKDPEVELNLPDKLEQKEYCPLTAEQAVLYEQLVQETMEQISKLTALERRGLILQMLNRIKQLCNHPALFLKEEHPVGLTARSEKLGKLLELSENIIEQNEACLIFTQYIG